ncbi:MAG: site-specific recombinase [Betaproteobacteria bacterium]|nr:site-specific recombinase [Betaproteobacteria bacterium]
MPEEEQNPFHDPFFLKFMESVLSRLSLPESDPLPLLAEVVAAIRPRDPEDTESATRALGATCCLLARDPGLRAGFRRALFSLFESKKQVELYASSGIFPNAGFFSEMSRRLSHTLLPEVADPNSMKDLVPRLFPKRSDEIWINGMDDAAWIDFFLALRFDEESWSGNIPFSLQQLLESLRVLSYRVAALGVEPELLRIDPALERFESPFFAQNQETIQYCERYLAWWSERAEPLEDEKHLLVLLDQCQQVSERVRKRAEQDGTSLTLTYHMQRLCQHLKRCERILDILGALHRERLAEFFPPAVRLFKNLVRAECHRNDLRYYWQQNVEILALRVTENAGHRGEHYITETRRQYLEMMRAAGGAGLIIAFMAMFKLIIASGDLAPLNETIAFSLNYGLGFVLIYMLHFTVATKQPAMTANAIAASIGEASGKTRDLENLSTLIARTLRTQIIAILGNVMTVVPTAILGAMAWQELSGHPFIDVEKAGELLAEHHLYKSGSIFYAAIAGVCLFLSGLIAGYYDNHAAYNRIGERLIHIPRPKWLIGDEKMQRIGHYVGEHLGGLAGNFSFGVMLGAMWAVGMLFGLPIDIRHVAFSSAYLGLALVSFDFHPDWANFAWSAAGVAAIAAMNLAVSFSLALIVALRARQVTFDQRRQLLGSLLRRLRQSPREFFLPPREGKIRAEAGMGEPVETEKPQNSEAGEDRKAD